LKISDNDHHQLTVMAHQLYFLFKHSRRASRVTIFPILTSSEVSALLES
jgi:hypothetical protein